MKIPKYKRTEITQEVRKCEKCGSRDIEVASGNTVSFKYRCENGHTWGDNEYFKNYNK